MKIISVLFVCTGNICRSPMAEAVFRHKVEAAGQAERFAVDSCAIGPWHVGEPAHSGTRQILRLHGIHYTGQARQITQADLAQADYLIAMDRGHLDHLRRMGSTNAEINLLMHYAAHISRKEVPDPYYSGEFDVVYDMVEAGCAGLLAHIQEQHNL